MRKGRDLGRAGPWLLLSLWLPRAGRLRLKRTRGTTPRCCWWGTSVTWRTSEWCPRNAVGSLPTTWVSTHRTAALIGLDRDPDPPHTLEIGHEREPRWVTLVKTSHYPGGFGSGSDGLVLVGLRRV